MLRGINTDFVCFYCYEKEETIRHLFVDCEWTKRVWFTSPLGKGPQIQRNRSLGDWLMEISKKESKVVLNLLVVVMWSIWGSRNEFAFKNKRPDPYLVSRKAMSLLIEYQEGAEKTQPNNKRSLRW